MDRYSEPKVRGILIFEYSARHPLPLRANWVVGLRVPGAVCGSHRTCITVRRWMPGVADVSFGWALGHTCLEEVGSCSFLSDTPCTSSFNHTSFLFEPVYGEDSCRGTRNHTIFRYLCGNERGISGFMSSRGGQAEGGGGSARFGDISLRSSCLSIPGRLYPPTPQVEPPARRSTADRTPSPRIVCRADYRRAGGVQPVHTNCGGAQPVVSSDPPGRRRQRTAMPPKPKPRPKSARASTAGRAIAVKKPAALPRNRGGANRPPGPPPTKVT